MIACNALILTTPEAGQSFPVEYPNDVCNVLAVVVHCARDLVWCRHGGETRFHWRDHKALVDINLRAYRMVNGHQSQIIVVVDLPEFGGHAYVVIAVVRHELIAPDLVPFAGGGNLRRTKSVDAQANGGTPWNGIFDELHLLAVIGEQERAGSFQS